MAEGAGREEWKPTVSQQFDYPILCRLLLMATWIHRQFEESRRGYRGVGRREIETRVRIAVINWNQLRSRERPTRWLSDEDIEDLVHRIVWQLDGSSDVPS